MLVGLGASYQLSVISYQLSVISSLRKLPTSPLPTPYTPHPTPYTLFQVRSRGGNLKSEPRRCDKILWLCICWFMS
ncbi:MAG: hypothetical protein EWV67_18050 [Microcystis sp. M_QC_C_20170808_M2Col]|nr:MAG: hypothetical protein EWV67_18050 [Microcystis sp. M_QC_C_20170808_M2Col]TRT64761.1 MAG: hypothetical protein EWV68_18875 [Microcystis sp. M_QC_C_20170808_M9Col]